MEQPSNINVTPVNRAFLEGQGILKGMGSRIKKRKMQTKPVQPKPVQKKPAKPVAKPMQKKDNNPWDDDVPKGYVRGEMGGLYKESVMKKHREEFGKALQSMKNHIRRVEEQAKEKEAKAALKKLHKDIMKKPVNK